MSNEVRQNYKNKFSRKLRYLLTVNELTQKEFADRIQFAPSTIGGYIRGVAEPDFDTLITIADFFKVSTDYLLGYNGVMESDDTLVITELCNQMSKSERKIVIRACRGILNRME